MTFHFLPHPLLQTYSSVQNIIWIKPLSVTSTTITTLVQNLPPLLSYGHNLISGFPNLHLIFAVIWIWFVCCHLNMICTLSLHVLNIWAQVGWCWKILRTIRDRTKCPQKEIILLQKLWTEQIIFFWAKWLVIWLSRSTHIPPKKAGQK